MIVQKCSVCIYSVNCEVQDKAKKYSYETGLLCVLIGCVSQTEWRRKEEWKALTTVREKKKEKFNHVMWACWCRMKEETWGRSNFNNTASSSPSSLSSCCVLFSETHKHIFTLQILEFYAFHFPPLSLSLSPHDLNT